MDNQVITDSRGKAIISLELTSNSLIIGFDSFSIRIEDTDQQCCELRFLTTDDDLNSFLGATFLGVDTLDAPSVIEPHEYHDVEFVQVRTSIGVLVLETHNIHNGYYGGFNVQVSRI